MSYDTILFDIEDGIARLTLNRPEVYNSLSLLMLDELLDVMARINPDEGIKALLVNAVGRGFCAGADLADGDLDFENGEPTGEQVYRSMMERFNPVLRAIQNIPVPTVAAVNGVVAGGGVGLALTFDLVVATPKTQFMIVFLPQLGIIPDLGATWHLPHKIGRARAMGYSYLGEPISGKEAAQMGLIWKCLEEDQFESGIKDILKRLSRGPTRAFPKARQAFDAAMKNSFPEQLQYEAEMQRLLCSSTEFKEGVQAFLAGRKPDFS
ncbi:MAG: enoyl-CoA hydratase/isomerase family protein [Deltaproteobacteria bacterium]|nr:enoyl-CoA hydratase/isomerase family protein [Deltaproteobacteria bacterium]